MLADQKGKSKEEVETWSGYPGGAPCNVAAGLARLGIPVAFASALGKDSKGDELFTLLSGAPTVPTAATDSADGPTVTRLLAVTASCQPHLGRAHDQCATHSRGATRRPVSSE